MLGSCCELVDAKENIPHATPLPHEPTKKKEERLLKTRERRIKMSPETSSIHCRTSTYLNLCGGKFDVQALQGTPATVTRLRRGGRRTQNSENF
uniref:Uncharacterized protein n=1 Tax=Caenorhabditis japonica TaxID=281687 RepID=A0A8R1IWD0_CAEJA